MDAQTQNLIGWVIGTLVVGILSAVTGVVAIIRSGKMLSKDLKSADLENKLKETNLADQYEEIADRAAQKASKMQEKFDVLEIKLEEFKMQLEEQSKIITSQTLTIHMQSERIDAQDIEIEKLKCEKNNSDIYIEELINQIKQASIIPVNPKNIPTLKNCDKLLEKKRTK
jgi:chromosome condensin MukBEF ATPase and DNA-binding subunit MukB